MPRIAMQYNQTCKKNRGRPRRIWFDGIREIKEKRGIGKDWSLDRPKWREVLENGK